MSKKLRIPIIAVTLALRLLVAASSTDSAIVRPIVVGWCAGPMRGAYQQSRCWQPRDERTVTCLALPDFTGPSEG